jgi:ApbE superfamily uncharacterized protein (UPF0280 family)
VTPQWATLPDGRLHLSHGPIDLIIQAEGPADLVAVAHQRAWRRFSTVLFELVDELGALRRPLGASCPPEGEVARHMWEACFPYRAAFLTPMAAVAGAVAQTIVACYTAPGMRRAAINNGGDIALHLSADTSYRVGVCIDLDTGTRAAQQGAMRTDYALVIDAGSPVRGVATSGWRGRSFSLGIADSVTVLAATAAQADVAATMIANAVNVDDARILRAPACMLKDDTDLGDLQVTVDVPSLDAGAIARALAAGISRAQYLLTAGLIHDAVLVCQGHLVHLRKLLAAGEQDAAPLPLSRHAAADLALPQLEPPPGLNINTFESRTARTCP